MPYTDSLVKGGQDETDKNHEAQQDPVLPSLPPQVLSDIEDVIGIVILNRPQKRNALSTAMISELDAALQALDSNNSVRAIVISGPPGGPFSGVSGICWGGTG